MDGVGLKEKTIKGVGWNTVNTVVNFCVHFFVSIVLARLLSPDDYGLIGIITIFITIADCITISGFFSSLIQKKDANKEDFNTMFISNIVSSTLLYIILFLCAPVISRFFSRPELVNLIRVQSIVLIISAFSLVQRARFFKILDFKTPAIIAIISSFFSGVLGILLALRGFGVWALVYSTVASSLITTLLNCILSHWMPNTHFSLRSFKELFGYGWKILVSELLDTVWMQLYQTVVAKYYSPTTLGQYSRGKGFVDMFAVNIYNVTRGVTFSALSQIQDDEARRKIAFRKMVKVLFFITSIGVFGVAAVSKSMVLVLIGEKWLPCVKFIQILCMGSLLYPVNATNMNLLKSQGRSDIYMILSIIRKVLELAPIFIGIFIDIYWMVIGCVVINWVSFFLYSFFAGRNISYSSWQQLKDLLPSLGIATSMAFPVWLMSYIKITPFILFPLQVVVGVSILFGLCELTRIEEYIEIKSIVTSYFNNFKRKIKGDCHE